MKELEMRMGKKIGKKEMQEGITEWVAKNEKRQKEREEMSEYEKLFVRGEEDPSQNDLHIEELKTIAHLTA